jgi:hypothetical protein
MYLYHIIKMGKVSSTLAKLTESLSSSDQAIFYEEAREGDIEFSPPGNPELLFINVSMRFFRNYTV